MFGVEVFSQRVFGLGQCWHGNWPLGACVWACLRIAAPFRNTLTQSGHDTGAAIVARRDRSLVEVGAFSQNAPTFHDWVDLTWLT